MPTRMEWGYPRVCVAVAAAFTYLEEGIVRFYHEG